MKKQTIIIVDDHKLFREGIELILSQFDFIEKIYQACDGKEYIRMLDKITPDIVLMDINMPEMNGIEATTVSKMLYPKIKIIALTMHDNVDYYSKMTEVGVDGFITKDTNANELKLAMTKVMNNENYFSQKILQKVISSFKNKKTPSTENKVKFSKREIEVIEKMIEGLSNQEISECLFISHRTVERHKENMFRKTGCKNGISLIVYAIKNKIIDI